MSLIGTFSIYLQFLSCSLSKLSLMPYFCCRHSTSIATGNPPSATESDKIISENFTNEQVGYSTQKYVGNPFTGDLIVCNWGISFQNNAISIRSPGKSWVFVSWSYFTFFYTLDIIFIGTFFSGISFHLPLFSLSYSSTWELSAFLFFIFLCFFSPFSSFFLCFCSSYSCFFFSLSCSFSISFLAIFFVFFFLLFLFFFFNLFFFKILQFCLRIMLWYDLVCNKLSN